MTPYAPLIRTQADLLDFWIAICHPLGWSRRDLWFCVLGEDLRPTPLMTQIEDLPDEPDPRTVDNLGRIWQQLLGESAGQIAALQCRPGPPPLTPVDRAWGRAMTATAAGHGVPLAVLHVASDEEIVPLPADEIGVCPDSPRGRERV
ncbi:hypothetical protein [Nocardioides sp.]|uniref:hypothetical protein n=1 Tax=Nocardioides sp. TaxID=35761 RepID=UPI0039E6720B